MKRSLVKIFTFCGLLLTLAATSVFAQENKSVESTINKKPFNKLEEKIEENQINLAAPFLIEFEGILNQDGKLEIEKSGFTKMEGNPQIIEIAKEAIEAINDSGISSYFKQLGLTKIKLSVRQDNKQFSVLVRSLLDSENRAKIITSGLNTAISVSRTTVKDEDTLQFLNNTKVENVSKNFLLSFSIPVEEFQTLIQKQLAKKAKQ